MNIDIELVKRGDQEQFHNLFLAYWRQVVHFADGLIRDIDLAEDIAQQSFIHLYLHRQKLEVSDDIRKFLFKKARQLSIDTWRKNKARQKFIHLYKDFGDSFTLDDFVKQTELQEIITGVVAMIAEMPEEVQKLLMESLKEKKNRGSGADYVRIHRAKKKLKEFVKKKLK